MHIEAGNRLSEVPHHTGAHVPSQKSTYGTKESLKGQSSTQQDKNALAGKLAIHSVPICTILCMLIYRYYQGVSQGSKFNTAR